MENNIGKKNMTICGVIILTVAIAFGWWFGKKDNLFGSKTTTESQLITASNEINQNLPIFINAETRLDSTIALEGKIFQYNFTLLHSQLSKIELDSLYQELLTAQLDSIRTNSNLKTLRDNKVIFVYVYNDSNGNALFELEYTYDDYKE